MAYPAPSQGTVTVVSPQTAPTTTVIVQKKEPNSCRGAIPSMHIAMAITCLILNIFIPGVGTIAAGFAVFCCGNPGQSEGGKCGTFCLNFWIGLLQLVLATFFFIGWIWAIIWGVAMITLSDEYHNPPTNTTVVTTGAYAPSPMVVTTSTVGQPQPQGYAQPLPQKGYQPPPQQQGYAYPPPQQGYAPPPQMAGPGAAYPPGPPGGPANPPPY